MKNELPFFATFDVPGLRAGVVFLRRLFGTSFEPLISELR
jgi:hypothetical protein